MSTRDCYTVPGFVKWAGGKRQLIQQLHQFMPTRVERYLEPFVGGGAVFFFVKHHFQPKATFLSDNTGELINCYLVVQNQVDDLIDRLDAYSRNHSKSYYYCTRELDPSSLSPLDRGARFLYLNKTCFNGLYRVNSKGQFNVPLGSYKNPNIVNQDTLRKASILLQGARIEARDFADALQEAQSGDFVYLDPPYQPLSATAYFTSYTANRFLEDEQRRLFDVYSDLDRKGCLLMQSNSDTPFIRNLYGTFRLETVQARRFINSDVTKRGPISELVILNY